MTPEAPLRPRRKKRKRRWIGWLVALGILAALTVTVLTLGEKLARDYAVSYTHDRLAAALGLPADHPMEITIGEGSIIGQAILGHIDSVRAHVDNVPIGDLNGTVLFDGENIPLNSAQPVARLAITVTLGEENADALRPYLSGVTLDSIEAKGKFVTVASTVKVFGFSIPFSVDLSPVAKPTELVFEPDAITIGTAKVSISALKGGAFGALASAILPPQALCVAQYLPQPFSLVRAEVEEPNLVLRFSAENVAFDDPEFSTVGTCSS